jgi:hypothetical protein
MPDNVQNAVATLGAVNNINFVEFTSGLVTGVFNSVVSSSITQMNAYAELLASVSKSLADFMNDEIGSDRNAATLVVIRDDLGLNVPTGTNPDVAFSDAQLPILTSAFNGIKVNGKIFTETATIAAGANKVKLDSLKSFVVAKLEDNAKTKYEHLRALLKLGMQKVVVDRGLIRTKLTFSVSAFERESASRSGLELRNESTLNAGAGLGVTKSELSLIIGSAVATKSRSTVSVNVVNERSSAGSNISANVVGEVVIEFRTDSFPTANL